MYYCDVNYCFFFIGFVIIGFFNVVDYIVVYFKENLWIILVLIVKMIYNYWVYYILVIEFVVL